MKRKRKQRRAMPAPRVSAVRRQTRELPMMTREAPVESVDAENRRATLVWTAGAAVRRYDWWNDRYYIEELSLDPAHVRMGRLQSGRAPVCDTHYTWSLANVIGVVDSATLEDGEGRAEIRMSRRDDIAGVVQDLVDGIIGNVSVGYDIFEMEMIPPEDEDGDWIYRAIDWEPAELSLVPIGADPDGEVESVRAARAANPNAPIEPFKDKRTHPCVFRTAAPTPAAAGIQPRKSVMTKAQRKAAQRRARKGLAAAKRSGNQAEIQRYEAELARLAKLESAARSNARAEDGDEDEREEEEEEGRADENEEEEEEEEEEREDDDEEEQRGSDANSIRSAERRRCTGIRNAVRMANLPDSFADDLIARNNGGLSVADAGLACLREQARRSTGTQTRSPAVFGVQDEVDVRRARMGNALRLRANPNARLAPDTTGQREAVEAAREFRGMTLIDMGRECIEIAGGRTRGMSRRELAMTALNLDDDLRRRAGMMSTSDFPQLMGNTINRTLRAMYQEAPRTFLPWTRRSNSTDFREKAVIQLSGLTRLQKVNEGGEYKYLSFGDSAEKYSLAKYGGIVAVTWETLINDDLGAFDRIPLMIANEAAGLESDIVYGILTGNPNMGDGVALFHANHGNLLTAAAITDVSLTAARAAMRKQTTPAGRQLNLTPAYLIVGPDNEGDANKYTSSQFVAAKAVDINPSYNTSLEVIVEGRIANKDWFLSASPSLVDTIEYSYLEGEEGLFTEQRIGFGVDGLEVKARHVFAAKAIDHRGIDKTPAPA